MSNQSSSRREALRARQEADARAARNRKMVGVGAAIVAVILVVVMIVVAVNALGSGGGVGPVTPKNATQEKDAVVLYNTGNTKPDAPTIDVYLDYQCPICKVAEDKYGATLAELAKAGEIRLVQHTMTFMDNNLKNTASTRAANAATCADVYGDKYAEMSLAIFANQEAQEKIGSVGYSDELLRKVLPAQVGITGNDLTNYQQCYDTKRAADFIEKVNESAYNKRITGTPTFTRNGQKLPVNPIANPNLPETTPDQLKSMALTGK